MPYLARLVALGLVVAVAACSGPPPPPGDAVRSGKGGGGPKHPGTIATGVITPASR